MKETPIQHPLARIVDKSSGSTVVRTYTELAEESNDLNNELVRQFELSEQKFDESLRKVIKTVLISFVLVTIRGVAEAFEPGFDPLPADLIEHFLVNLTDYLVFLSVARIGYNARPLYDSGEKIRDVIEKMRAELKTTGRLPSNDDLN